MHIVRIAFATGLALLAIGLSVGEFFLFRDHASVHLLDHAVACALIVCLLITAAYFFRPKEFWDRWLTCPTCRHSGTLRLATFGQPRLSILAWIAGGFIGSLLYSQMLKRRFRCDACGASSRARTVGGWLAAAWLFYIVCALAVAIFVHGSD